MQQLIFTETLSVSLSLSLSLSVSLSLSLSLYIYIFDILTYFCVYWVFIFVQTFFSCNEQELLPSYSSCTVLALQLQCSGISFWWLLLLQNTGSRAHGFSSYGMWAQLLWLLDSRAQAQQLLCLGLVALRHVGPSWIRDQTCVSCIGRQILYH